MARSLASLGLRSLPDALPGRGLVRRLLARQIDDYRLRLALAAKGRGPKIVGGRKFRYDPAWVNDLVSWLKTN